MRRSNSAFHMKLTYSIAGYGTAYFQRFLEEFLMESVETCFA